MLHKQYGKKVTIALCGPVGEYQGLIAGIAFSDKDGRPARLSARGGVGAVMGVKKVKAIVVDLDKIPPFSRPQEGQRRHQGLRQDAAGRLHGVELLRRRSAPWAWPISRTPSAACPCATSARARWPTCRSGEKFKMGGDYIGQLNVSRGGEHTHACMPGCVIQCSNVYHDAERQGSGLAGRVRDARAARHQLRHRRSRTTWPSSTTSPTTWASTPSRPAPCWPC